ncbi:MAG: glycosyltransferase [Candidatus Aegiribacteria sp.]|nr:glycosyltransferase [Candidatus Aegiribacteria sp.]
MRICDTNSLYSETGGGIRIYHDRKLEYFAGRPEHSIALVIPGRNTDCTVDGNTSVYRVKSLPLLNSGYRLIVDSGGLTSAFGDFKPDLVEVGSPYLLPIHTRKALGNSDVPIVGFYHSDYPDSYVKPFASKYFPGLAGPLTRLARSHVRKTYGGMTAVFAASRCILQKLYDSGVKRLFLTPLGVSTDQFSPSRRSDDFRRTLGVCSGSKLVLYLARLHREKGLDLLIAAYPLFRDPASIKLVIGGHGPAEGRLVEFIKKYPEVRRLPYLPDRDAVAEAMASADVYLSLGQSETFGLASLEAIACGTTPVLPDSGASGDMAASLGFVPPYRSDSPESLANAIVSAAAMSDSETTGYLRRFALDGHDWDSVFRRIEVFYERIISAFRDGDPDSLIPPEKWWEE